MSNTQSAAQKRLSVDPLHRGSRLQNDPPLDYREFYATTLGIRDAETLTLFTKNTRHCTYKKGEIFAHAGEPTSTLRFLLSGVARGYHIDENGQEHVVCFAYRYGDPLLGAPTLSLETQIYMDAVTKLDVLEIPVSVVIEGIRKQSENVFFYEKLLSKDRMRQYETQLALKTLDGKERYRWFCDEYKDILFIVPQNHIASFLGIRPQSLSRIKRQIQDEWI